MRRLLYAAAFLDLCWILGSLFGLLFDSSRLELWTHHLMLSLLTALVLAPALVFRPSRTSSSGTPAASPPAQRPQDERPQDDPRSTTAPTYHPASQRRQGYDAPAAHLAPTPPSPSPSAAQYAIRGVGLLLGLSALTSLGGLVFTSTPVIWTQGLLWSLLGLLIWGPLWALWPMPSGSWSEDNIPTAPPPPPFIPPSPYDHASEDVDQWPAPSTAPSHTSSANGPASDVPTVQWPDDISQDPRPSPPSNDDASSWEPDSDSDAP